MPSDRKTHNWYEVWADETLDPPYVLVVRPDKPSKDRVLILDPQNGKKVIHSAPTYEDGKMWLLEDEYTRIDGRMEMGD